MSARVSRRRLLPLLLLAGLAACGKRGQLRLPEPGEEEDAE